MTSCRRLFFARRLKVYQCLGLSTRLVKDLQKEVLLLLGQPVIFRVRDRKKLFSFSESLKFVAVFKTAKTD